MQASRITAPVGAFLLAAVPALAAADAVTVDHGHGPAYVYDATYAGVRTQVHSRAHDGVTDVRLIVDGMPAGRRFGAHVHLRPCGPLGSDAGGHYQHGDAGLPLAEREIWLDFTPDADGHGVARARVPWLIAAGTAGSVVVHAAPTDPVTGAAGARLFCTTVPFGQ
ncbi:superoxide dismutase family protein [Nocardioides albidus]|uniref:Superoxide dismutase family protein n=1 Tax=Nocardioides albidus TaxID=1517589 RepID=A0A5C4WPJ5_9ACTN|nr:superoxide dismutase family protein [Nocardioides albidus]TNM50194.1 superoxide dismutase family protein [Nocardioides albidus]